MEIFKKEKSTRTNDELKIIMKLLLKTNIKNILKEHKEEDFEFSFILYNLAKNLDYELVKKGEIVFRIGDPGDKFYIILEGAVSILKLYETELFCTIEEYLHQLKTLKSNNEKFITKRTIMLNWEKVFVDYKNIENVLEKIFLKKLYKSIKMSDSIDDINYLFQDHKREPENYGIDLSHLKILEKEKRESNITNYQAYISELIIKLNNLFNILNNIDISNKDKKNNNNSGLNTLINLDNIKSIENEEKEGTFQLGYLEEKKRFLISKYEQFFLLTTGQFFGDFAIDTNTTRSATLMSIENETHLGILNKEVYCEFILKEKLKIESGKMNFLYDSIFNKILNRNHFEKKYYKSFIYQEFTKGHVLFKEKDNFDYIYIIYQGKIDLSFEKNYFMLEKEAEDIKIIHPKIFKFYEDNYSNPEDYNGKYTNNMENHNKNNEMKNLNNQLQKKKNLLFTKVSNNEILGLENFIFKYPRHCKATVVSEKFICFKIDSKNLEKLIFAEKDAQEIFEEISIKKLIIYISRLKELSKSFMELTKFDEDYKKKYLFLKKISKDNLGLNTKNNTSLNASINQYRELINDKNISNFKITKPFGNRVLYNDKICTNKNLMLIDNNKIAAKNLEINEEDNNYKDSDVCLPEKNNNIIIINQSLLNNNSEKNNNNFKRSDKETELNSNKFASSKNQILTNYKNFIDNQKKSSNTKSNLKSYNQSCSERHLNLEDNLNKSKISNIFVNFEKVNKIRKSIDIKTNCSYLEDENDSFSIKEKTNFENENNFDFENLNNSSIEKDQYSKLQTSSIFPKKQKHIILDSIQENNKNFIPKEKLIKKPFIINEKNEKFFNEKKTGNISYGFTSNKITTNFTTEQDFFSGSEKHDKNLQTGDSCSNRKFSNFSQEKHKFLSDQEFEFQDKTLKDEYLKVIHNIKNKIENIEKTNINFNLVNKINKPKLSNSVENNKSISENNYFPSTITNIKFNFNKNFKRDNQLSLNKSNESHNYLIGDKCQFKEFKKESKNINCYGTLYDDYSNNNCFKARKSDKIEQLKKINSKSNFIKTSFLKSLNSLTTKIHPISLQSNTNINPFQNKLIQNAHNITDSRKDFAQDLTCNIENEPHGNNIFNNFKKNVKKGLKKDNQFKMSYLSNHISNFSHFSDVNFSKSVKSHQFNKEENETKDNICDAFNTISRNNDSYYPNIEHKAKKPRMRQIIFDEIPKTNFNIK